MEYAMMVKTMRGYENVNVREKLVGCVFSKIWIAGDLPEPLHVEVKMRAASNDAEIVYVR